jgi:hypothetical protein
MIFALMTDIERLVAHIRRTITDLNSPPSGAAYEYASLPALPGFETQAIFRCGELTDAGKLALSPM